MEFLENELGSIANNFCGSYNNLNKSDYYFYDTDDKNNNNYDFRITDGKNTLKIQCKTAIAEEPNDFINLENMFRGREYEQKKAYVLIHDNDRFKYTLEHIFESKTKKYSYTDCILLVIFSHFPFSKGNNYGYYLKEMKSTAEKYKRNVKEIWIANEPGLDNQCWKIL